MIDSLLVANRGEIAVRIFRTCRRLGIRSVGVYSDADARALHVSEADEAVRIGPPEAAESYLNQAVILEAARQTSAAAIHPGYGFLAENADFAQAVLDAGRIWVGPPPDAMRALGDKAHARALAARCGVPLLAGYHADDQSAERLEFEAERIGYPVLIKASAGGGGRGMRVVESATSFQDALQSARREALAYFGDDRVLVERYVRRPRHVEIQIFGDQHGTLVHLGERECSIQRRHQKLIEESPSAAVGPELRTAMTEAALRLGRAAGYANAGTVEFLLDEQAKFAFLEVNARLQVEHPVTEAVTGLDLVELQLRVAAGEPLGLTQADIPFNGHAIEARVLAEDALAGFLPSSGRIDHFGYPSSVRVDTWITDGTDVSPHYDSLLAKVIAYAPHRAEAARLLASGLEETWIDGVADNIDLLLAVLQNPALLRGELDTSFLERHHLLQALSELPLPVLAAVAAADVLASQPDEDDPWRARSGWRAGRVDQPAAWWHAGKLHTARVSSELGGTGLLISTGSARLRAHVLGTGDLASGLRVSIDGRAATVRGCSDRRVVNWEGRGYRLRSRAPLRVEDTVRDQGRAGGEGRLTAPMPGRVVKLSVRPGQHVVHHQPLVVLEAMKMEHVVEAPHAGVVSEVWVAVGDQVASGARLLALGSAGAGDAVQ